MTIEAEFVSPITEKDALLFRSLQAREEIGRLSEYQVELLRPTDTKQTFVKPKDLLGLHAGVRVLNDDGTWRYFNGIVTRFERGGMVGRYDVYRVELRPWLWQLTMGADCRVYQDKTAVQIIDAVFAEYGSTAKVEKKLKGSYSARPYTVQYRESDFNFVTRLMEEEGIYYYFTHAQGRHTLVLADAPSAHAPKLGGPLFWAPKQEKNELRDDIVTHWHRAHQLGSLKYAHTDFDAGAPSGDLLASADRKTDYAKPNELEVFNYPGGHDDLLMGAGKTSAKVKEGKRTAQLHVDSWESSHSQAGALTPDRLLTVGSTFIFKDHPEDSGGYLVTSAITELEFAGYEANPDQLSRTYQCRFDCVPKTVNFQPERIAQTTIVLGPQTATVVGPKGEEIHTDKFGRVKVQFHWDRVGKKDEKSSCFVRVAQPWASKGFGFINLPRLGDEVVVEFLEGNPDRPLIIGRVYNADNMPPYELPAQATVSGIRTRSSKGGGATNFNELRFDDKKGSEYVWFQAEKDFHRWIKNDLTDKIDNNSQLDIKKNHVANIGEAWDLTIGKAAALKIGADTSAEITGDLNVNVKAGTSLKLDDKLALKVAQAIAMSAGMGLDIDAGQAMKLNAGMGLDVNAGMGAKISAGMDMSIKATLGINVDGGMTISLKAGPSSVVIGPDGVSITGPMVKINSGGAAGAAAKAAKAAKASPTAPKAAKKTTEKKDPLAK